MDLARLIGLADAPRHRARRRDSRRRRRRRATPTRWSPKRWRSVPSWPRSPARADSIAAARIDAIAATRKPHGGASAPATTGPIRTRASSRARTSGRTRGTSSSTSSWQFWDSGRAQAERAEAQFAIRRRCTSDGARPKRRSAPTCRSSSWTVATPRAALAPARLAVTAAQETRRVVNDRFEAGVATTLDVLDAQLADAAGRARSHARAGRHPAERSAPGARAGTVAMHPGPACPSPDPSPGPGPRPRRDRRPALDASSSATSPPSTTCRSR